MRITEAQLRAYQEKGFLFLPECFSHTDIDIVKAELPTIFAEDSPRRVLEKGSNVVRSVYGSHTTNEIAGRLAHHPCIVEPAMQILDGKMYIHQFKINVKAASGGDVWEWHQDYIFWRNEDGMPTDRVVNAVIFLDDVHEFNGPMIFLPGSHKEGVIDVSAQEALPAGYQNDPIWIASLTATLKYSLNQKTMAHLVEQYGMVAPKGPAGSVLFFHGNIVHGSAANMSPFARNLVLVTFNHHENIPIPTKEPRPEFLASRDYRLVEPRAKIALLS